MWENRIEFAADWNEVWPVFVLPTITFNIYTSIFNEKKLSVEIIFIKFNIGFEVLLKKLKVMKKNTHTENRHSTLSEMQKEQTKFVTF